MRAASGGKFSLGSAFGRKADKHERSASYSGSTEFGAADRNTSRINGAQYDEQPDSPNARMSGEGGSGGGGGGVQLKKLGKTFAHNNLLPGLGNKDLKALQDVIAAEKGVLSTTEKLATEIQKAASVLPNYGLQEGPDLQDILTQSSYLLNYFSSALNVYAERQVSLRGSYKKIRDREEEFMELRSQRRSTGSKAEAAERKLSKMGPENKALPAQTELLERLRQEMKSMDSDIAKEETSIGDFKRQIVKEAFMYKFSGLEELGEKLCIIGEMGKLVIDEIPLEETPVGYGRAPYGGFTKTESAVEEAGRCIGQVKFANVEIGLKPSHLPHAQHLRRPAENLPRQESIAAAEEFAHYPAGMASPQMPGRAAYGTSVPPPGGSYGLDENPYGGIRNTMIDGGEGDARRQTLWQGPTEDALRQQNRGSDGIEYAQARIASMYGHPNGSTPPARGESFTAAPVAQNIQEEGPDYEHQQQMEMDRQNGVEQAAWREQSDRTPIVEGSPNPHGSDVAVVGQERLPQAQTLSGGPALGAALTQPWQPLNVQRGKSPAPESTTLHDNPVPVFVQDPTPTQFTSAAEYDSAPAPPAAPNPVYVVPDQTQSRSNDADLLPPPSLAQLHTRAPTPGTDGFRTPAESPNLEMGSFQTSGLRPSSPDLMSPTSPSVVTSGVAGKMSAGAFRTKVAPRRSETTTSVIGDQDEGSELGRSPRKLPVPPGGYQPGMIVPGGNQIGGTGSTIITGTWPSEKRGASGAFEDAKEDHRGAPPVYGDDSLR